MKPERVTPAQRQAVLVRARGRCESVTPLTALCLVRLLSSILCPFQRWAHQAGQSRPVLHAV